MHIDNVRMFLSQSPSEAVHTPVRIDAREEHVDLAEEAGLVTRCAGPVKAYLMAMRFHHFSHTVYYGFFPAVPAIIIVCDK